MQPVSETLFLPLYALALESGRSRPFIEDQAAVRITEVLDARWADSPLRLHQKLRKGRLPGLMVTTITLRVRHFNQVVREFLHRHPSGMVVSLGAGLSTRAHRVDNGTVRWLSVDLPAVAALRQELIPDTDRTTSLGCDVLDHRWMDVVPTVDPVLFVAEGLLMYLEPEDSKALVLALRERFPGAELVAELSNAKVVRMAKGALGRGKFRRQFGLSEDVWFHSGVSAPRELQRWAPGIVLLDEWSWFDEDEPRLRGWRVFAGWELFGRAQFVAHYRLNADHPDTA